MYHGVLRSLSHYQVTGIFQLQYNLMGSSLDRWAIIDQILLQGARMYLKHIVLKLLCCGLSFSPPFYPPYTVVRE